MLSMFMHLLRITQEVKNTECILVEHKEPRNFQRIRMRRAIMIRIPSCLDDSSGYRYILKPSNPDGVNAYVRSRDGQVSDFWVQVKSSHSHYEKISNGVKSSHVSKISKSQLKFKSSQVKK